MRPIELTIKGINSYSEEQTVDFTALMKEGVFGIFGPTGSGKSTILDGITLALYGELARKSKNFIHVGGDSGAVSFTFSITEKETKIYRVYRTFKTKKDTGYSVAAKARLCELIVVKEPADSQAEAREASKGSDESGLYNEVVLEDSISGVKERIQKIVGLEFEDFTRTVVLPQGKFSEFLKLSGTDRNQMLERLFHLYDYGIALTDKVKRKTEQTELRYRTCMGKLAEHAGETKEALDSLKKDLRLAKREQKEAQKKQQVFSEQFDVKRVLWEMQKELDDQLKEYRLLEEQKEAQEIKKQQLQAAERAAIVKPFWEQEQNSAAEFEETVRNCECYAAALAQAKVQLKKQESELMELSERKALLEEGYQEKLHRLERACELEIQFAQQSVQLQQLEEKLQKQVESGEAIDQSVVEKEAFLQKQKELLTSAEHAYYAHMEESVRKHLYTQMERDGICPVCGSVHDRSKSNAHVEAEDIPVTAQNEYQQIEKLRAQIAKGEAEVSKVKQEQLGIRTAIAAQQASVQSMQRNCEEKKNELCKLLEACGIAAQPSQYKKELETNYRAVCTAYDESMQKLKAGKEQLAQQEIQHERELAKREEQEKNLQKAQAVLAQKLSEQGFVDAGQMNQSLWEAGQLEKAKQELQAYEKQYNRVLQQIEILKAKVGEQRMDTGEYEAMLKEKEALEEQLRSCAERIAVYAERIVNLEAALVIVGQLEAEKKELEHRKAILLELMTLLKGKKFVEYVARERLSYVAGEASEKLMEITGGIFGLELKDSGEFVIRDYKNGGIIRNVNSLSGGELFLVSLSLALALSTQIQLKGTAPLEFFFLDEGFGTLDESLLDTVMDSLDKLHHDRRKIGIISHVDAIKERVPVKLLVTPAKVGEGGSRLEIVC